MAINKVILIGNVGKDPEIRAMTNGNEIATFSLATTDSWKDKTTHEKKEKTEWHKVVVYSAGLANIVKQYVKRGTKLYIEGSLQTRKWTATDGTERYATEVVLQGFNAVIQIISSPNSQSNGESSYNNNSSNNNSSSYSHSSSEESFPESDDSFIDEKLDDEIPF
jgi:single-strand DNA-binding protein